MKKTNAKKNAWNAFSKYIRLKECYETAGNYFAGKCCTCGAIKPIEQLDAGHFIPGRNDAILFDERGVHIQCRACNRFHQGRWPEYREYMLARYGMETIEELLQQRKQIKQYSVEELKAIAKEYRRKIKELEL